MDLDKLWQLATPYLEKNDFGIAHTQRVFAIAKQNFHVEPEVQELTYASIILHDIGGCTIKDQYEKGPEIAAKLLKQLNCPPNFIIQVCQIVGTHHDHPTNPPDPFRVLYDADKIVMFTPEEYGEYNARESLNWEKIVSSIYSEKGRAVARKMLKERKENSG